MQRVASGARRLRRGSTTERRCTVNHKGILKRGREVDASARKTLSDRAIARIVGVLFIVGTVAGGAQRPGRRTDYERQ